MYQDYLNEIINYYRAGEKNGDLPQRLMQPTPGSIKDECISVCEVRLQKEDLRTLTAFFKADNDQPTMLRAIHRCDRDRFRPLVNFLKGITNNTDDLNIELLAWLIDFPDRPFRAEKYARTGHIHGDPVQEKMDAGKDMDAIDKTHSDHTGIYTIIGHWGDKIRKIKNRAGATVSLAGVRRKIVSVVAGVLLLTLLGSYFLNRDTSSGIFNTPLKTGDSGYGQYGLVTSAVFAGSDSGLVYARCTGSSPCRACSNCTNCKWCSSGGTCGICAATKKASAEKLIVQCQAITKKGKRCSRAVKGNSKYCWQHGK